LFTAGAAATVLSSFLGTSAAFNPWSGTSANTYLTALTVAKGTIAAGDVFNFYFPKDPYASTDYYASAGVPSSKYFSAGSVENIFPSFVNFRAPEFPFTLVLQVTKINTAVDTYRWKIAGDMAWSDTFYTPSASLGTLTTSVTYDASGAAAPLTDTTTGGGLVETSGKAKGSKAIPAAGAASSLQALYNIQSFLRAYPDDPTHHDVQYVRLDWLSGSDNQARQCNTAASTYYLQFGSDGLNDSPECSDRGVCDYTSGICKCFKGYAGIDCTTQNALSGGAGATVA